MPVDAYVIDSSVALSWCFVDEQDDGTLRLLKNIEQATLYVPNLWHLEITNVLLQSVKRKRIALEDAKQKIADIGCFPIVTDDETSSRAFHDTLNVAEKYGLTSYDAAYLELALRRKLPLATKDVTLAKAAGNAGVPLLLPRGR